ncbi:MAG: HalD/BesD family halogenase [bacterium]
MQLAEIIDLERYPLHDLDSEPGVALIELVRDALRTDGSCTLDGFISDLVRAQMLFEAESLIDLAYPGPTEVSPYFFNYRIGEGMQVDDAHPIRRKGRRNLRQVAADLIPPEHLLSQLYHSPLMTEFLGRVLQVPIYRNQDRYQSLNISVMEPGGCQQWHFDGGNMVTTLLLQAPERGGNFEYAPNIRSQQNENFEQVRSVLDGCSNRVQSLDLQPGTLSLFRGHYSLHRVTEVEGVKRRLQAILGYTTQPNLVGNLDSSILHYGPRVAEIERATSI